MQIVMDYSALIREEKILAELSSDLKFQIDLLIDRLDVLDNAWDGQTSDSYLSSMREKIIPELLKIYPLIEDYGTYAKSVAEAFKMLDDNYYNKKIMLR